MEVRQMVTPNAITPTTGDMPPAAPVRKRGKRSRRNSRCIIFFDGCDKADWWMAPGYRQSKPWLLTRELQGQRLSPLLWADLRAEREKKGSEYFKSIQHMLLTSRAGIHHRGVNCKGAGEQGLLNSRSRKELLECG